MNKNENKVLLFSSNLFKNENDSVSIEVRNDQKTLLDLTLLFDYKSWCLGTKLVYVCVALCMGQFVLQQ